jgi:hypothetical protein
MRQTLPRPRPSERLRIAPVTLRAARAYVDGHHRHLRAPAGAKLALSVRDDRDRVRGVALLGRPVARQLDDGFTIEVTRVATDGCTNACSALYGAARRVAIQLGYSRVVTYTRAGEPGTSLRAAGWTLTSITRGGSWDRVARRRGSADTQSKRRWEAAMPLASHA